MKLLIVNGPNLNLLGIRERHIYGDRDYNALCGMIRGWADDSNCEGEIVDRIQQAYFDGTDGIVINPAAYTHTSVAILDALKAVRLPAVEVHISDVNAREPFRHISYAGMACEEHFIGLGFEGYHRAMAYLAERRI